MSIKESIREIFLKELYNRAGGNFEIVISMYEIGKDLGIKEDESAELGQELFIEGLAEMKTLSGGMGITGKGIEALGMEAPLKHAASTFRLKKYEILDDNGEKAVHRLLDRIRADLDNKACPFELMEETVIALKTIEVQMLSPRPRSSIIMEIFNVLYQNLKNILHNDLRVELKTAIS